MVSDKVQKVSSEFSSQLDSDPDTHIVRIRLSVHKKKPSSPVDQSDAFASVTYDDDPERMSGQSSRSQTNSRLVFLETDDGSDHPHKATQGKLSKIEPWTIICWISSSFRWSFEFRNRVGRCLFMVEGVG